jgi:hypothetical protein
MNAFLKTPDLLKWLTLPALACYLLVLAAPVCASPSNRMAGSVPGTEAENGRAYDYEGDESRSPEEAVIRDVDFRKIESLGLLSYYKEGAIGKDVWHSMNRSDVMVALLNAGPSITSRSMTTLAINTLLSRTDAGLIKNDIDPEPGQDIYTIRINKLLEFGLFQEALDMYALQRSVPYHPELASAGVLAMLGSGNLSLACLESKSFENRFKNIGFWQDLAEFCRFIIDEEKNPDKEELEALSDNKILRQIVTNRNFKITYSKADQFTDFSFLELGALFAAGRIGYSKLGNIDVTEIPSRLIGLMLSDEDLPKSQIFPLTVEAVRRGIRDRSLIDTFFEDIKNKDSDEPPEPEDFKSWKGLPEIYGMAIDAPRGEAQWKWLKRALEVTPKEKWPALLPFAQMFEDSEPPADTEIESLATAIRVMFYSNLVPGDEWEELFSKLAESESKEAARKGTILLTALNIMDNSQNLHNLVEKYAVNLKDDQTELLIAVINALDISYRNRVETGMPYEKGRGLTFGKDYVMPSVILTDYLDHSFSNKLLGGEILFSAIALRSTEPDDLFPGLVRQVIAGLSAVGQNIAARGLAFEAVLGLMD